MKNDAIRLKRGLTPVTGLVTVSGEPQPLRLRPVEIDDAPLAQKPAEAPAVSTWTLDPDWKRRLGDLS